MNIFIFNRGLNPAEADLYFLDNAKKMALYGMELYAVKDSKGREVGNHYLLLLRLHSVLVPLEPS